MGEQRDIVALAHYITSGGDTLDSIFISALLGTLLAALPSVLLLRFFPFPIRLKAVATLPSFVILGILTGARMQSVQDSDIHLPVFSGCMMMTVAIALCVASLSLREDHAEHNTVPHYMCSNVVILSLGVLMSIIVSNHNRELHDQLLVERLMHQGDTRQALDVGTDYTVQNRNITAMHALALSREGRLADELVSQPGLKGSESLIPDTAPACRIYLAPCMVARHIQAAIMPGARMSTARFLEKAMEMRQQAMADTLRMQQDSLSIQPLADYYLCSLLLDRKLSEFVRRLPQCWRMKRLPRPLPTLSRLWRRMPRIPGNSARCVWICTEVRTGRTIFLKDKSILEYATDISSRSRDARVTNPQTGTLGLCSQGKGGTCLSSQHWSARPSHASGGIGCNT